MSGVLWIRGLPYMPIHLPRRLPEVCRRNNGADSMVTRFVVRMAGPMLVLGIAGLCGLTLTLAATGQL